MLGVTVSKRQIIAFNVKSRREVLPFSVNHINRKVTVVDGNIALVNEYQGLGGRRMQDVSLLDCWICIVVLILKTSVAVAGYPGATIHLAAYGVVSDQ